MKQRQQGFTLIEMIGVLAIIAILVGAVAPRIFEAIQESNANNVATLHKTTKTAVTKFYADMGALGTIDRTGANVVWDYTQADNVDAGGAPIAKSFSGLLTYAKDPAVNTGISWSPFRGPYLDEFQITAPPTGSAMYLDAEDASAALAANNDENYDLNFSGAADIPTGSHVISMRVTGVTSAMYEKVDAIIDGGQGTDPKLSGKVKYSGTTMLIYVAHE